MESFDSNDFEIEPDAAPEAPIQEPAPDTTYHNAGANRRESPYANSPYEMHHRQPNTYYADPTPPAEHPKKAKKNRKTVWKSVLACLLVVALVAGGCSITAFAVNRSWESRNQALSDKIDVLLKQIERTSNSAVTLIPTDGSAMTPSQLYAACVDSVVAITATVESTGIYGNTSAGTSSGSGFILTEDGYIVSNYHVVEDSTSLKVTIHDGTEYEATLIGKDSTNDVAVLKVDARRQTRSRRKTACPPSPWAAAMVWQSATWLPPSAIRWVSCPPPRPLAMSAASTGRFPPAVSLPSA